MRLLLAALVLALSAGACTDVDEHTPPPAGWPALVVVEHQVPHREMRERCMPYTGPLMSPEACTEFDFINGRCLIWYSADFPPPPALVEHERLHCAGYDHPGSTVLRDLWTAHQAGAAIGRALTRSQ